MKPRKGRRLVDASFKYTSAAGTDLRATFRRVRAAMKAAKMKAEAEKLQHQPIKLKQVANGR